MSGSAPSGDVIVYRHQLFKTSERFIQEQALALERYRPVFVGESVENDPPPGASVRTFKSLLRPVSRRAYRRYSWRRDPRLFLELLPKEARLIHAHFGVEGVYALPLAKKARLPLLVNFHGFDATTHRRALFFSANPKWITYAFHRRGLARSDAHFLCTSDYIRDRVLALGFPEDRTRTHYIGVDTQRLRPPKAPVREPLIVHVARLVAKKGTADLIRAFAKIAGEDREARLAIIGDGPLRRDLEDLVSSLGLDRRVGFVGAPADHGEVVRWLQRARVFCLPSKTAPNGDAEGLGMVLLEAAALGIPVVGTRHGGIPETMEDGRTGTLVPEGDTGALARALSAYLRDESLARRHGEAGRRFVESWFDLRAQTRKLEELYGRLWTQGGKGR